jgi:dihydrofolate reductase
MASLVLKMSVSLDGYVASADGSSDWVAAGRSPDGAEWVLDTVSNAGTHLIGAATYAMWAGFWPGAAGPFAQPMNEIPKVVFSDSLASAEWGPATIARGDLAAAVTRTGWWGDDPPYHAPVFVLTHHPRESLSMEGGTIFNFVTDGIESALEQAHAAASDRVVSVAGGASTVQQCLAAGMLDELYLHIVPIILGAGERLLENVGDPTLEPINVIASPAVTHVRYHVAR